MNVTWYKGGGNRRPQNEDEICKQPKNCDEDGASATTDRAAFVSDGTSDAKIFLKMLGFRADAASQALQALFQKLWRTAFNAS
jgi:hypothetical protein